MIEKDKIKVLERITLNGFANDSSVVKVVGYNGDYYCIDDPVLLKNDNVKIVYVGAVNSKEELLKMYINNIVKNDINPFRLALLKDDPSVYKALPPTLAAFLDANSIDREVLLQLDKYVRYLEARSNNSIISIRIEILKSIKESLKLLEKAREEGIGVPSIIKLINDIITINDNIICFPTTGLVRHVKNLIESRRKEVKKRRKERAESNNILINCNNGSSAVMVIGDNEGGKEGAGVKGIDIYSYSYNNHEMHNVSSNNDNCIALSDKRCYNHNNNGSKREARMVNSILLEARGDDSMLKEFINELNILADRYAIEIRIIRRNG